MDERFCFDAAAGTHPGWRYPENQDAVLLGRQVWQRALIRTCNLKTTLSDTYHAFDFAKYAHRYLAEVQYRFNRRFDLGAILSRLLKAAVLTAPNPEDSLRMAESAG